MRNSTVTESKVLNTLTEIYLILRTKGFVGDDSLKTRVVWKKQLHALLRCDFGPFFHTKCF